MRTSQQIGFSGIHDCGASFHMFLNERQNGGVSTANVLRLASPKAVPATLNGNQPVGNAVFPEFTRHDEALLMRHVGVFRAMDHQVWRVGGETFKAGIKGANFLASLSGNPLTFSGQIPSFRQVR